MCHAGTGLRLNTTSTSSDVVAILHAMRSFSPIWCGIVAASVRPSAKHPGRVRLCRRSMLEHPPMFSNLGTGHLWGLVKHLLHSML